HDGCYYARYNKLHSSASTLSVLPRRRNHDCNFSAAAWRVSSSNLFFVINQIHTIPDPLRFSRSAVSHLFIKMAKLRLLENGFQFPENAFRIFCLCLADRLLGVSKALIFCQNKNRPKNR